MKHYVFVRGDSSAVDGAASSRVVRELSPDADFDALIEAGMALPVADDVVKSFSGEPRWVMQPPDDAPYRCVFCFNRKIGMERDDFLRYWREHHALIVPKTPGLAGYLQCALVPDAPFDAVTELYWRDRESIDRSLNSDELNVEQREDSKNFVDRASIIPAFVSGSWWNPIG